MIIEIAAGIVLGYMVIRHWRKLLGIIGIILALLLACVLGAWAKPYFNQTVQMLTQGASTQQAMIVYRAVFAAFIIGTVSVFRQFTDPLIDWMFK